MKTRWPKAILVFLLIAAATVPAVSVQAASFAADLYQSGSTGTLPDFPEFVSSVTDGYTGVVRGIYVPNQFAMRVVQQPANNPAYVSTSDDVLTQFGMAARFDVIGILAHNYLAGRYFSNLIIGQEVRVVYGDGQVSYYAITAIYQYQALQPDSPTSNFVDLNTGARMTANELFIKLYQGGDHITFQTCIANGSLLSWGRLFVIAEPIPVPEPSMQGKSFR
jgi:hypothetical protein